MPDLHFAVRDEIQVYRPVCNSDEVHDASSLQMLISG
jgi:hypothetical protein